jgi:predicted transcriptional regulator of viral defense system
MNVKRDRKPIDRIREILIEQNEILFTSDLAKLGIPRTYLSILEKTGEIQRVSRGVYSAANAITDQMAGLLSRYKTAIFSHETALYLWDLTDRIPLFYSVTVPTGYNANLLKAGRAKVYFVKRDLFSLGITTLKSSYGNDIKAYSLERTICDVIRSRNQMEVRFINEALKRYVGKKESNITLLYDYAEQFKIQKIVRTYLEILL